MPSVTILIGLPGSGKSTLIKERSVGDSSHCCFDDFHGGSLDGTGAFTQSRHYETLKELLHQGLDCVIADIEYCRASRLTEAERGLLTLSQELGVMIEIKRVFFENDPSACRHNVIHRFDHERTRDYIAELEKIDALSAIYECPAEGTIPIESCCCKRALDGWGA